jgi:hypothetical protein
MKAPSAINDPAHWQQRAEQVRRIADQLTDPAERQTMQEVAASYEELSKLAAERPLKEE